MRKLLFGLAAGVLGFALTASAQAHEPDHRRQDPDHRRHDPDPRRYDPSPYRPRPEVEVRNYHRDHGVRHGESYHYPGRDHSHWGRRVWDPDACRYHYWDSGLRCYYHWCPHRHGYYPVRERPHYRPF